MSQFILCKGGKRQIKIANVNIKKYPFDNKLLSEVIEGMWSQRIKSDIWTIENNITLGVDCYFTDAQRYINNNGKFQDTELYKILYDILDSSEEVITWYSNDIDDIPITSDKKEFLQIVEEGVRESFCEVYIKYIKNK